MKRKRLITTVIVLLLILLINVVMIKIRAVKVEQELIDTRFYMSLVPDYDSELTWSRKFYLVQEEFRIDNGRHITYAVRPFNSQYQKQLIAINSTGILREFPNSLWADETNDAKLYYPDLKSENNKKSYYDWLAVSFDRSYSIEEISQMEILNQADWFWIDTYQTESSRCDFYSPALAEENSAYGIKTNRLNLKKDIVAWITTLNQYGKDNTTVSGSRLQKIKEGITSNSEISLSDIRIIGCRFRYTEQEDDLIGSNPIFRCVYGW